MKTTDYMSERERQDLRDAGRGHLLGEYASPLERADRARTQAKEGGAMITAGDAMRRVLEQLGDPEDDSDRVEEECDDAASPPAPAQRRSK